MLIKKLILAINNAIKYFLLLNLFLCACTPIKVDIQSEQEKVIAKVAASAEAKHYYAYAATLRNKYLILHPGDYNTMLAMAQDLHKSGDWRKSIFYLDKLVKHNPTDLNLRVELGDAYLHLGSWQYAFEQYRFVLSKQPNIAAYNGMGVILNASKHFQAANNCFNLALSLRPDDVVTLNNQALTNALLGDKKSAITTLNYLALIRQDKVFKDNLAMVKKYKNIWYKIFPISKSLQFNYSCKKTQEV